MLKKKLNKVRITAIVAQIIAILSFLNVWHFIGVTGDWVNQLVGLLMQLAVLWGIFDDGNTTSDTTPEAK